MQTHSFVLIRPWLLVGVVAVIAAVAVASFRPFVAVPVVGTAVRQSSTADVSLR